MTEKQITKLASEIAQMHGIVPDFFRLTFARAIRDVVQSSKDFPGWTHFLQECKLTGEEQKPVHPIKQLCINMNNWDLWDFLKVMGWEQDSYSENMFLKFQEAAGLLSNFDSISMEKISKGKS